MRADLARQGRWWQAGALVSAALVFAVVAGGAVHSCGTPRLELSCPAHLRSDGARTLRLLRMLKQTEDGRAMVQGSTQTPRVCYDTAGDGVLRSDGILVLSATKGDWGNAARLLHLMVHRSDGIVADDATMTDRTSSCSSLVERLMSSERRAHAAENRILLGHGLQPGNDTLFELELAYTARCRRLRAE